MDVQVNNADAAISTCDSISEKSQRLYDACETLRNCLKQISQNWESNGADKQSYVTELELQISNIDYLTKSISSVSSVIKDYAENIKNQSSNTMGG